MIAHDLLGKTFGKLVVLKRLPSKKRQTRWNCKCICGEEKIVTTSHLVSGAVKSCGRVHYELGEQHHSWKGYGELGYRYYHHTRRMAMVRRLTFNISIKEMWNLFEKQNRRCALSGVELTFDRKKGCMKGTASIDRINSAKGYTPKNIQWIHKDINFMKGNLSENDFLQHCRNICKHLKNV